MDVSTEQAIAELQEIADHLLESCGSVDDQAPPFWDERGRPNQGYMEYIHALIEEAQESARRFKANAADCFKQFEQVRRAKFLLSKLFGVDIHALIARIRLYFSHLARIRAPLFEYGPELSGYRHRLR
ncbi:MULTISPECIES: hypothetical protein [Pseudomonas]|uniref:Uncharacterized protein n=1 Tax=Pseudomonas fluorescens TaxID=294 RepID=A0AAE2PVY6_PSEFL|nr:MULTISPECIES: hypothetical protein [Pseudomonas]MEE3923670.1 hypothetical protein [Pseudomonas viridiflava]MBD8269328.1 hypothetical protein [Pseudomonas fluorescens]MBI6850923.1 hypothetical protein [Pseudomonas syringae]MBX6508823.1 hypothetical protein [Pseudomonas syringae pv. tomato]MEE3930207.1 hypothetical protein [Pseudomonas viridiflava]